MKLNLVLATLAFWGLINHNQASAEVTKIEDFQAQSQSTEVAIVNGQASSITFKNGQIIDFVILPDQSKSVFTPNSPIASGNATALYLRKIDELDIPGATRSNTPNLVIETLDSEGNRHEYEFLLNFNPNSGDRDKIAIISRVEQPLSQPEPEPVPTIKTKYGLASASDIALGLNVSIQAGEIENGGKLVASLQELIALMRNGVPVFDAIEQTQLRIGVIEKLATIGQQEDARQRLLPLPKNF